MSDTIAQAVSFAFLALIVGSSAAIIVGTRRRRPRRVRFHPDGTAEGRTRFTRRVVLPRAAVVDVAVTDLAVTVVTPAWAFTTTPDVSAAALLARATTAHIAQMRPRLLAARTRRDGLGLHERVAHDRAARGVR